MFQLSLGTMALPSSSVLRRRSRSSNRNESLQLYCPAGSSEEAVELLDQVPLTNQDIIDFCGSKPLRSPLAVETDENARLRAKFHERRAEIRDISERLKSGGARIDDDGRLVAVTGPPQPPADLPAPPQLFNFNQQDNEQEENRLFVQEQREASESIALIVKRYREHSVPEEDFELILIEPREGANVNLTFRRICLAVLAVVTAFVCVILQTLPLHQPIESLDPHFDGLMHELLHMRPFHVQAMHCPGLHRVGNSQWSERIFQFLFGFQSSTKCDEGVLHIPALYVLLGTYLHSPNEEEVAAIEPFANGINVSWFLPCEPRQDIAATSCCSLSSDSHLDICTESIPKTCFRGVHDKVVTDVEVDNALRMGNSLIVEGGDHFDIHYEMSFLEQQIPSILDKLRDILRDQYNVNGIRPVAYRVYTVGPMDGYGVNLYRSPALTLNQTLYRDWVKDCKRRNELARYSLPWPFQVKPIRDTCTLMADMEVDPRFAIHTSVFLSDGAGAEYRGGVTLYVDNHRDNSNPKHKVHRGVTIDGSRGRVVVSTGGMENRRCRLPTRAGLRTTLQIWWDRTP